MRKKIRTISVPPKAMPILLALVSKEIDERVYKMQPPDEEVLALNMVYQSLIRAIAKNSSV